MVTIFSFDHMASDLWKPNLDSDVITFQNLNLKIHQRFYLHQAYEAADLNLFTILQLNSVLRLEIRAFWISGLCRCVTQGCDLVC